MRFWFFPVAIRQHNDPKARLSGGNRHQPTGRIRYSLRLRIMAGLFICAAFLPPVALSQSLAPQTDSTKSRWSGRVELGALSIATTSLVIGPDSDRHSSFSTIDSLDKEQSYEHFFTAFLLFNVNYQLTDTSSVYLGTPFFDDTRQGLTAGIQKLFPNDNLLDISIFTGGDALWKDPYLTGVKREATVSQTYGLMVDTDGLFGFPIHMNYMIQQTLVDDDVSGDNDSRLRREGISHKLKTGYTLFLDETFESLITPSLILTRDNRKGDANAYYGYGMELSYSMEQDRNAVMLAGTVETSRYDEVHPVFSKRRNDMTYSIECFYTRKHLWDKNWYLRLGCGLERIDSSIGFFDATTVLYGISVGYSFE